MKNWAAIIYIFQMQMIFFTENETDTEKVLGVPNKTPFVKCFSWKKAIIKEKIKALRDKKQGTKCAPVYNLTVNGNSTETIYLRLSNHLNETPFEDRFAAIFEQRKKEADEFYRDILPKNSSADLINIQRQAFAGLLWSKQFYHYDVERWVSTYE